MNVGLARGGVGADISFGRSTEGMFYAFDDQWSFRSESDSSVEGGNISFMQSRISQFKA